jgi:hypothetical protein
MGQQRGTPPLMAVASDVRMSDLDETKRRSRPSWMYEITVAPCRSSESVLVDCPHPNSANNALVIDGVCERARAASETSVWMRVRHPTGA